MRTRLTEEAVEFEAVVDRALAGAGGFDLIAKAEAGEDTGATVESVLADLDVWSLTPRTEELDAEVAAAVCRAAGRIAAPYPVAERLAGDPARDSDAVALAIPHAPRVNLYRPELRWALVDGDGRYAEVVAAGRPLDGKLGALVVDVEVDEWRSGDDSAALALTLQCWTLLGMCEKAFEATRSHLLDRHQFGKALAGFQALQFQLADVSTTLQGFAELAKYTVWSVATGQEGRFGDAVALRLSALDTAEKLFRAAHQMHGAMGFCDEVNVSWLSRYSQPIRRFPWGRSETEARLLDAIEKVPFAGLFSETDELDVILAP